LGFAGLRAYHAVRKRKIYPQGVLQERQINGDRCSRIIASKGSSITTGGLLKCVLPNHRRSSNQPRMRSSSAAKRALPRVRGRSGRTASSRATRPSSIKNDAVRKTDGFGNVGSHQQNRETAATPDVFNQALNLDACKRVHGTNRLIQMQQVGVVDKNASQCNPLALSTRQVCRPVIGSLGQADLSQDSSSLGDN
jgi:hypothetical protein